MEELSQQVGALFSGKDLKKEKFPHQIAFNCIPHIDVFMEGGYTKEEWKMINETRKILGEPHCRSPRPRCACRCSAAIRNPSTSRRW